MGTHFREQDGYTQILEITPDLRKRVEETIEHLVSLLDHLDRDPDFEPDADWEPDDDGEQDYRDFPKDLPEADLRKGEMSC